MDWSKFHAERQTIKNLKEKNLAKGYVIHSEIRASKGMCGCKSCIEAGKSHSLHLAESYNASKRKRIVSNPYIRPSDAIDKDIESIAIKTYGKFLSDMCRLVQISALSTGEFNVDVYSAHPPQDIDDGPGWYCDEDSPDESYRFKHFFEAHNKVIDLAEDYTEVLAQDLEDAALELEDAALELLNCDNRNSGTDHD